VQNQAMFVGRSNYYLLFGLLLVINSSFGHQKGSIDNLGAFCSNDTSLGVPNLNPIDDSPPRFVNKVENGSLYMIGTGEDQSWLIHVWGTSGYDYGFAYGTLLREQISKVLPRAWAHFEERVMKELSKLKLPKWFEEVIADKGLAFALDVQNELVQGYVDNEIYEEMRGIADAAKLDYKVIRRLHMLGEITRGEVVVFCIHFS
jgi:hypothetical protein